MKSYLRHSKDRRVRGSANGAATVCVCLPGEAKIFSQTGNFFPLSNLLQNYKSFSPVCLPPDDTRVDIFSLHGPHAKSDQLLITVFPK